MDETHFTPVSRGARGCESRMAVCEKLYITMLAGFSMCRESGGERVSISEQDKAFRRMWTFLQYMSAFRQRTVSQEELIEVLWGHSELDDPANALKTLLHRARAVLESIGFADGKKVLCYRRGVYSWHPELEIVVDTEEFDRLCAQSGALATEEELGFALRALALYTGDFLPGADSSSWPLSLRAHYHAHYFRLCGDTAAALGRLGRYDEAIDLCRAATLIDPYEEAVQLRLMQLLAASGARQAAIARYAEVAGMLMDELGVVPSQEVTELYRELSRSSEGVERDLSVVRRDLTEKGPKRGAFFCQYVVFRDIYRLEARKAARSGQVVQLVMLTLTGRGGGRLDAQQRASAMLALRRAIYRSLRSGDVCTRFSATQFLVLLPTANHENSVKIIGRILRLFHGGACFGALCEYSLLPVLSALSDEGPEASLQES